MQTDSGLNLEPRKLLIIKPSSLGDVVHALPVLSMLHGRFPDAAIDWVIGKGFDGILQGNSFIRKLWVIDKNSWKKPERIRSTVSELRRLAACLRAERYDLVIDLQGLLRSAVIGLFTGCALRVGFEEAREGARYTYRHRVATERELHAVEKNTRLALFLGCRMEDFGFPLPELRLREMIEKRLPAQYFVIAPSAGTLVKRWPAERFGELASRLRLPAVVVGSAADREICGVVVAASKGRAFSLAGEITLIELAAIISRAKFLLSPDTGPMHIAAALNVPVFAVFGPTNPVRTGPYGSIHTIIRKELECSPCYSRKPCADWSCMEGITAEMVEKAIRSALIWP